MEPSLPTTTFHAAPRMEDVTFANLPRRELIAAHLLTQLKAHLLDGNELEWSCRSDSTTSHPSRTSASSFRLPFMVDEDTRASRFGGVSINFSSKGRDEDGLRGFRPVRNLDWTEITTAERTTHFDDVEVTFLSTSSRSYSHGVRRVWTEGPAHSAAFVGSFGVVTSFDSEAIAEIIALATRGAHSVALEKEPGT